jgi:hypothetical protein
VTVKVIGVWDTVGALGLPRITALTRLGLQSDQSREMSFYDTKLSSCVENAFQALALDERRTAFSPAVWEKPAGNQTVGLKLSTIRLELLLTMLAAAKASLVPWRTFKRRRRV